MDSTAKHFRKRSAILACLRQTKTHPSAEMLYAMVKKENPDISLATVYRNLALFRQQGLVISLGAVNGVERFDGNVAEHAHFICRRCGSVQDLPAIALDPPELRGAWIESCNLCFSGLCRDCLAEGGEAS